MQCNGIVVEVSVDSLALAYNGFSALERSVLQPSPGIAVLNIEYLW